MSYLYSLKNLATQDSIKVTDPAITLGRDDSCDLVIDSEEASRQHARLEVKSGEMHIQDLGSTNGTFLQNRKIRSDAIVQSGDTITIGSQTFLVINPNEGANKTIFGARLEQDGSFVLEKDSPDSTSIRMRFPTSPGWSEADSAGLAWASGSKEDRLMDKALRQAGVDLDSVAAALLVTSGELLNTLLLVPRKGENGRWTIGRVKQCDMTIKHLTVSSHHADLVLSEGLWLLQDLESTNGIKVNDKRRKKSPLVDGDKLKVGQVECLFRSLLTF